MADDDTTHPFQIRLTSEQRIMLKHLCRDQSHYYGRVGTSLYSEDSTARFNCIRLARRWKELELLFHQPGDDPDEPEGE